MITIYGTSPARKLPGRYSSNYSILTHMSSNEYYEPCEMEWIAPWGIKWHKDTNAKTIREYGLIRGERFFTVGWDHRKATGKNFFAKPSGFMYNGTIELFHDLDEAKLFCHFIYLDFLKYFFHNVEHDSDLQNFWKDNGELAQMNRDGNAVPYVRILGTLDDNKSHFDRFKKVDSKKVRKFSLSLPQGELPQGDKEYEYVGKGGETCYMDMNIPFHRVYRKFLEVRKNQEMD